MAGLFQHLMDVLPVYAALQGARASSGFRVPPASSLIRFLQPLSPGDAVDHAVPPVPTIKKADEAGWTDLTTQVKSQYLWGWKHNAGDLGGLADIHCRVRETGYKNHVALEKVRWGYCETPVVEVTHASGQLLKLPLEVKYLQSKWRASGGYTPKGGHLLYPLEAMHDSGLVLAFVYELDVSAADGSVKGIHPFTPTGHYVPEDASLDTLLKDLAGRSNVGDKQAWLEALSGPFMALPDQVGTTATTGETKHVPVSRPRILVVVGFSTFRERADFEPGGLVGMAKIFPHIMVRSSVQITKVDSSVTLERPASTTTLDNGNGSVHGTCCGANPGIAPLLVSDSNDYGSLPQKPFWAGVFAYVAAPANKDPSIVGKKLKVVDKSKTTDRTAKVGRRHLVFNVDSPLVAFKSNWGVLKEIKKVPRQGEFDNLHLAPSLALKAVKARPMLAFGFGSGYPLSNALMKLDPIYMAPFCSHDCYHTHWRWSENEDKEWTKGWDSEGPYRKSGAPMVAENQDVHMEIQAANKVTYHATAEPLAGQKHIKLLQWQITMHHGSAFAQGIADWVTNTMSNMNSFMSREMIEFYDAADKKIDNSPRMYWYLRYYPVVVNGHVEARERVDITPAEMLIARQT